MALQNIPETKTNMDFTPDELFLNLPFDLDITQLSIAQLLVKDTCFARYGRGPSREEGAEAPESCGICMEDLDDTLTLRHHYPSDMAPYGKSTEDACRQTYHLMCLVDWAQSCLTQNQSITCPGDRQLLMADDIRKTLRQELSAPRPPRSVVRPLEQVIPFWEVLDHRVGNPPRCSFGVRDMSPDSVLSYAGSGHDVGFISREVVNMLPLDGHARGTFHNQYDCVLVPGTTERVYKVWIYVNLCIVSSHHGHQDVNEFALIPIKSSAGPTFYRYLLGTLGNAHHVSLNTDQTINAQLVALSDDEVIDLHAECEIRTTINQLRALRQPAPIKSWYWPFNNQGGGILIGRVIDDEAFPALGYHFTSVDISHSNKDRFARLTAESDSDAQARSDALVNLYITNNLQGYRGDFGNYSHAIEIAQPPSIQDIPPIVYKYEPTIHLRGPLLPPYAPSSEPAKRQNDEPERIDDHKPSNKQDKQDKKSEAAEEIDEMYMIT